MPKRKAIAEGLAFVFQGIERLKTTFPHRRFTVDGRLVGDVGEIIAELEYDVILRSELRELSKQVAPNERIPKREG